MSTSADSVNNRAGVYKSLPVLILPTMGGGLQVSTGAAPLVVGRLAGWQIGTF